MSSDTWIRDHDELERQSYEIFQKINQRNQMPKFGVQYSRAEAQVSSMKRSFDEKITSLQQSLVQISARNVITRPEAERRQRLLDALSTKSLQMDAAMKNTSGRSALLGAEGPSNINRPAGGGGGGGGANVWMDDDEAGITPMTSQDYRDRQQQLFREQDRGLEVLDEIITRQKSLARGIGTEIDIQNEIIDEIGDNMDQTNERLIRNTRNIKKISMKSDTCCYWIVIIMLFIANVAVLFWPKK